ncbi:MAG: DUF86 domain-containing protein [Anaerolineales bacterium]
MPILDKRYALRKMRDLKTYLTEFQPLVAISLDEYQKDYIKRHAVEKLIELIVEVASDINRSIIEEKANEPSETYYSTFTQLNELKVLPKELSHRLASTAGLRNRLVHHYEEVEHKIVYQSAVRLLKDYRQYFQLVEKYLQAH